MKPLKPLYTNTTYILPCVYKNQDGTPKDITGASATLVIRKDLHSEPVITGTGIIDGLTGSITFSLPPEATNITMPTTKGQYLVGATLTLVTGEVIPLFQTTIDIEKSVVG